MWREAAIEVTTMHAIHRVSGFRKAGRFTLEVSFDDGTMQTIDFRPHHVR